jgi:hypothetical protein
MAQNEARPKDGNCRYFAAGKGIGRVFSQIANDRFCFSRSPVSTTHPLSGSLRGAIQEAQYIIHQK